MTSRQERKDDFYRIMLRSVPDLVLVLDENGNVTFVSESLKTLLGYDAGEVLGRDFLEFIHPDDRKTAFSNLQRALRTNGMTRYSVMRVRHADGGWRHYEASALNLLEDPQVRGLLVNARDVTERVEEARILGAQRDFVMQAARARTFDEALRLGLDAFLTVSGMEAGGSCLLKEGGIERLVVRGFSEERVRDIVADFLRNYHIMVNNENKKIIWVLDHPYDLGAEETGAKQKVDVCQVILALALHQGEALGCLVGLSSQGVPLSSTAQENLEIIAAHLGEALGHLRMDEALRESEERFRLLAEHAQDLIYRIRLKPEQRFEYVSPSATAITGYTPEEHYADPWLGYKIVHPDDRHLLEKAARRHGEPPKRLVLRWIKKDGTVFWTEQINTPIYDETGELVAIEGIARDVTERVLLEQELRESRRQLETLLSNLPGMAYRCRNDRDWTMLFVSEGCRELTGYSPEEILENKGVSYGDVIHEDDRDYVWDEVQRALGSEEPFKMTYRIRTAGGETKWVWEQGRGVYDDQGNLLYLEGFITDISDLVWAEKTVELQRDLAVLAVSALDPGKFLRGAAEVLCKEAELEFAMIFQKTEDGRFYRLLGGHGVPDAVMESEVVVDVCEAPDVPQLGFGAESIAAELVESVLPGMSSSEISLVAHYLGLPEGEKGCLVVGYRGAPREERIGRVVEVAATSVSNALHRFDLLERLRDSEYRYRLLYEEAGEAIFTYDRSLKLTGINRKGCELIGFPPEELIGKHILELGFVMEEDLPRTKRTIEVLFSGKTVHVDELALKKKDGSLLLVEITGAPIFDRDGRVVEIVNIARDITDRKRAEEALRASELRYRATFEATGTAMFHVNRRAVITDANKEAEKLFGYSREEMVGRMRYMDLLMPEEVEKVKDFSRKLLNGEIPSPLQVEIEARHKSGRPVPALITVAMLPGIEESVISLLDITEIKNYQDEILRREEELRDFLDVAAHELRHPASLLKGYAITLMERHDRMDDRTRRGALEAIDRGAERLVRVVEELLEVARLERRRMTLRFAELDPEEVASQAVEEMKARFPQRSIRLEAEKGLGRIRGDPERLERLLVILLDNAVKYSPQENPVDLLVRGVEGKVLFSVLDRGKGVPEQYRERIFERFFQGEDVLHHSSPGLGLGLYIAKNIAEAHGGRIWHEARPGGGSIFHVLI